MDLWFFWLVYAWGFISLMAIMILLFLFGKFMVLQTRIWLLAKRGYHCVEIIGSDRVRRYYYMRPKDDHFDVNAGFFLYMPDTITKQTAILQSAKKALTSDKDPISQAILEKLDKRQREEYLRLFNEQKEEARKYFESVNNLHYHIDAVTLRWGIPTITYVGDSSEPVNYKEKEVKYSAKTLKDLYLRILLTQKYGIFRTLMIVAVITMIAVAGVLIIYYMFFSGQAKNYNNQITMCITNWNITQRQLVECVNVTGRILAQNSTLQL